MRRGIGEQCRTERQRLGHRPRVRGIDETAQALQMGIDAQRVGLRAQHRAKHHPVLAMTEMRGQRIEAGQHRGPVYVIGSTEQALLEGCVLDRLAQRVQCVSRRFGRCRLCVAARTQPEFPSCATPKVAPAQAIERQPGEAPPGCFERRTGLADARSQQPAMLAGLAPGTRRQRFAQHVQRLQDPRLMDLGTQRAQCLDAGLGVTRPGQAALQVAVEGILDGPHVGKVAAQEPEQRPDLLAGAPRAMDVCRRIIVPGVEQHQGVAVLRAQYATHLVGSGKTGTNQVGHDRGSPGACFIVAAPQSSTGSTTINGKGKRGLARLRAATACSMTGFAAAWRSEEAFRQEVLLAVPLLPAAFWLGRDPAEVVLLAGSWLLVMIVELLNTAVEATVDRIGLEHHPLSGTAKDLGSAAVLTSLGLAMLTWSLIGWSRFAGG